MSSAGSTPILFVDGDKTQRRMLGALLGSRFHLRTAGNGNDALELLESPEIAVLLADRRVSDMSGTELCARARLRRPGLVTLITAAYGDLGEIADAMKHGHVTAHVPKPWIPSQVIEALEYAAAHSGRTLEGQERTSGTVVRPRRSSHIRDSDRAFSTILEWGPFRVDLLAQRLWVFGQEVRSVEPLQVRVLGCLIERAGTVWHRDELCERLYSQGSVNSRALARAVWALRQRCGAARDLIVSVRAVGYGLGIEPATTDAREPPRSKPRGRDR